MILFYLNKYARKALYFSLMLIALVVLSACGESSDARSLNNSLNSSLNGSLNKSLNSAKSPLTQASEDKSEDKLLARVGSYPIYESEIQQQVKLQLFELEWAKYELKRQALKERVESVLSIETNQDVASVAKHSVHIMMTPPIPPRIERFDPLRAPHQLSDAQSNKGPAYSRPNSGVENAPVVMSIFCNYQSIHCGRMAATYKSLEQRYQGKIHFNYYDLPQKFHRYSPIAAQAARCAYQMGSLDNYQSALWASQDDLQEARLIQLAEQLDLDKAQFSNCMNETKVREAIKADMQLAHSEGFSKVPVTLINGLYLNGPKSVDELRYYVDHELERVARQKSEDEYQGPYKQSEGLNEELKEEMKEMTLTLSELPLRFEGVSWVSIESSADIPMITSQTRQAEIRFLEEDRVVFLAQDAEVLEGIYLVMIEKDRIVLENDGRLEYLPLENVDYYASNELKRNDMGAEHTSLMPNADSKKHTSTETSKFREIPDDVKNQELEYKVRPVVASNGMLPLSKRWLNDQLDNQGELEAGFTAGAHEVEGKHLLKLKGVSDSEFYQTLGLKEGDSVMRVNGEWVHEQHNNLFDVLEQEEHVSIVVMRKGLPVHLEYAIR